MKKIDSYVQGGEEKDEKRIEDNEEPLFRPKRVPLLRANTKLYWCVKSGKVAFFLPFFPPSFYPSNISHICFLSAPKLVKQVQILSQKWNCWDLCRFEYLCNSFFFEFTQFLLCNRTGSSIHFILHFTELVMISCFIAVLIQHENKKRFLDHK